MSKLLAMASTVLAIVVAQPTLTTNAEEDASKKETNKARTPSAQISRATEFAPSKDLTNIGALLTYKAVQRELGLTDEQAKKLDEVYISHFNRHLPVRMALRNNFQNPEKRAELEAQLDVLFEAFSKEIKAQLSKSQARRLTQISAQNAGLRAFLIPEVADALNLAPDRQVAIKEIIDAMEARERQLQVEVKQRDEQEIANFPGGRWDEFRKSQAYLARYDQYNRALEANRAEARREIFRLLTQRQQKTFKELLGPPFDPEKHRRPGDVRPSAK